MNADWHFGKMNKAEESSYAVIKAFGLGSEVYVVLCESMHDI